MTNPRAQDLTSGSIPAHLFRLALPMIWGILAIVAMQLADVYYIAGLGHLALESISFTFPVSMTLFNLVMGLSIATSAICARLIGEKSTETLKHFLAHALVIACGVGVFLAVLGEILLPYIFDYLGAGPEHMPAIMAFMRVSLWGYVFVTVPLVANAGLRAAGDTFIPSIIMVLAALINFPLAYALVYGAGPFPAWGVAGAASANVISNALVAVFALYVLIVRHRMLDRHCVTFQDFGAHATRLFSIALPVGVMNLIQPLTAGVLTAILSGYGAHAVAAYGVIGRVEALAAVVLMAVSIGMSPIIGQNYGARRFDRIEQTIDIGIRFCVFWSIAVGLGLMLFGSMLARAFTDDPETIQTVALYFMLTGISAAVGNIAIGWGTAWNALAKPQFSAVMTTGRFFIGGIVCGYLGHLIAGLPGLFMGLAVGNIILGTVLHFWSRTRFDRLAAAP